MNYENINKIMKNIKGGTIHTLTYEKPLETRKGVTDTITKVSKVQVVLKTNYNNHKVIKEARAKGYLPAEPQSLPKNTSWLDDRRIFIKSEKTGEIQLRCMKANGNPTITTYYKNGVQVEKAEVEPLCLKKEFPDYVPGKFRNPLFNIGIGKVIDIK